MAARLRVSRLPGILDRYRKWDIVLDGKAVGSVANGQTSIVRVESGTHTVQFGHRWLSSPVRTFTVKDQDRRVPLSPTSPSDDLDSLWGRIVVPTRSVHCFRT